MAMTFTLVTLMKDKLLDVAKTRLERQKQAEAEEERRQLEVSEEPHLKIAQTDDLTRQRKRKRKGHPSRPRLLQLGRRSSIKRCWQRRIEKRMRN